MHWVSYTLTGKAKIHTKATSEMLIRRRLYTLKSLVSEYNLTVSVTLVMSYCNFADQLIWVPYKWYVAMNINAKPSGQTRFATVNTMTQQQIKDIHVQSGHPGIKWMLYFVRCINLVVAKAEIKEVIKNSELYQSIDSAPAWWQKGWLKVSDVWQRVGMDITHYGGNYFLTLINCGPTYFAIW